MKILVVFTGGTIGSSITDGSADVDSTTKQALLSLYTDSEVCFEQASPFNILSENSTCDTLSDICNFMLSLDCEQYSGVIITHGSDTLAYTAAMLGLVLSWVSIPVVITAADYVLSMPQSNGRVNFSAAVDFIRDFDRGLHSCTGVFAVWKNREEAVKVYLSTRLNEADGFQDSFSSFGGSEYGIIRDGHFIRTESSINPNSTAMSLNTAFLKGRVLRLKPDVLLLSGHVGFDFTSVNTVGKSAVVFKLYHSSTACTEGENTSFTDFSELCRKNGIDVYIYPTKDSFYKYKSAENLEKSSVVGLGCLSTACAYCKVLLAYSLDSAVEREYILSNNIFYEDLFWADS